ncbi:MAG: fused MFS/spermidine synthase [Betaproteobacteria bacterium]|nr:fused MFS/spermidine synthase [Betaproteobacteria bacterium]
MTKDNSPAFRYFLMLTTTLCGGLVMVIEVLGARVIGPYFGVSLFVWTALITVTLLSLSAGYALGGYWADRKSSPDWLYGIIVASGVLVILVPTLKPWVIQATVPMGLRAGALASAILLFAPALLLLGCVSPYVVRIAASEWSRLGRTVGILYALSTIGSMLGTALAGYVIIAYVGVARAFHLCGALLVLLGLAHFLVFRRKATSAVAMLCLSVLIWRSAPELPSAVLPDGTQARLVAARDSYYGNIKVVDYSGTVASIRELLIDGMVQGGIDRNSGLSIYEYTYLLEALPMAVKPDARSALIVGLGAGVVADRLQRRNVDVEAIDIDPAVVEMAETHFNLRLKRPAIIEDARYFLAQDGRAFDIVIMDAFTGDTTPSHLLSQEALARVMARLAPDGVVALNLIASNRADSRLLPAVVRTLHTQFSQVAYFPLFNIADPLAKGGNIVLIASNRALDAAFGARVENVPPMARELVALGLRQGRLHGVTVAGPILSDDFNPLDVLDVEVHEMVRKTILETTPAAILLHG